VKRLQEFLEKLVDKECNLVKNFKDIILFEKLTDIFIADL
jgi:hypothetical protein